MIGGARRRSRQRHPMLDASRDLPHFYLAGGGEAEAYTSTGRGSTPGVPQRDRDSHARALEVAIGRALLEAREQLANRDATVAAGTPGYYLEMEFSPGQEAVIDRLGNR